MIFVPVMASRLMLSLKKAIDQPNVPWSLEVMTTINWGESARDETIDFASRVPRGLGEISRASAESSEEDMELGALPRLPRNRDSKHGP